MYLILLFSNFLLAFQLYNRFNGFQPYLILFWKLINQIIGLMSLYEILICQSSLNINLTIWLGIINVEWNFIFDSLTIIFLNLILLISFFVEMYSKEYLHSDPHQIRFFSILSLFIISMFLIITADNLIILFLGWELVGLTSYLLINFWYTRLLANFASLKALFINKIGDWMLIISIILITLQINDTSMTMIFVLANLINGKLLLLCTITLLIACLTKSSQFSFHTWLISAMEGPTPVSSLLHSSTMVILGVYLLIRFSPLFEWSSDIFIYLIWFGSLSAILGAINALIEYDIKKIIAFSTTSQLGYLFIKCGLSQYNLVLFHIFTHAFFKCLLFLSAGIIIHSFINEQQDIRKKGSLTLYLPLIQLLFVIGSLSLKAFPFFSGFYSKDFLINLLLIPYNFSHSISFFFTFLAAIFTLLYSLRSFIMIFYSLPSFSNNQKLLTKNNFLFIPVLILSLGAICFGYQFNDLIFGFGTDLYSNSIFIHPNHIRILDSVLTPFNLWKLLPLLILLLLIFGFPKFKITNQQFRIQELINFKPQKNHMNLYQFANTLNLYNIIIQYFKYIFLSLSIMFYRYWDKGLLELLGPLGIIKSFHFLSVKIELLSTNFLLHYIFLVPLFLILLLLSSTTLKLFWVFLYIFFKQVKGTIKN